MTDLATARDSLLRSYDAIEDLCGRLTAPDWQVQSLCPDWKVRDVIQHLALMERVMAGWVPDSADELPDFSRFAPFNEEMPGLTDADFARRVTEIFAVRRGDLAALTQDDMGRPSWTPVGVKTFGRFLEIRVFDFWVHERDITTPLGWATDDTGPRAEISLAEVTGSLGYIVGKRISLPDGASIVFHLTGPLARDLSVAVDGRAKLVEHVDSPDVEVTTDLLTFMQLACGRIDPQAEIDAGQISWTGNDELGTRAARNLRFTM